MADERPFDVVIYGATGFTGELTAEYLAAKSLETPFSWAIAGRDPGKLEQTRERLAEKAPRAEPAILVASSDDPVALRSMTEQAKVVATTVGPFVQFGDPLVAACVDTKTDYADITGEPEFVGKVVDRYDASARERGVRIVNCCGFDSVPHDLGALLTVQQLPADSKIMVDGCVLGAGSFSGGTWHSAVRAMGRMRQSREAVRGKIKPAAGRRVRGGGSKPRKEPRLGCWLAPLPTIDPWMVLRSACVLPEYGTEFRYRHYVRVRTLPKLLAGGAFIGSVAALAQLPPTRSLLLALKKQGDGPDEATRSRSRFSVVFFGSGGGQETRVEVSGGDPGYGETSKMLAESALCLVATASANKNAAEQSGVLTPAVALGNDLIDRLRAAGMKFEVQARPA